MYDEESDPIVLRQRIRELEATLMDKSADLANERDRVDECEEALQEIICVLGPEAPKHCEGCQAEMQLALDIAREALQEPA